MCEEINFWGKPRGIPDWRNPKNYDYDEVESGKNISLDLIRYWKWQFIRRCPKYQYHWLQYDKNRESWEVFNKNELTIEEKVSIFYNYDYLEDPNNYRRSPFMEVQSLTTLKCVPTSELSILNTVLFHASLMNDYVAVINPNLPLKSQFDQIKSDVKNWKEETNDGLIEQGKAPLEDTRQKFNNYPLFIRLLDARQDLKSGKPPTWEVIAKHIKKEDGFRGYSLSRFKSNYKKAKEYCVKARNW